MPRALTVQRTLVTPTERKKFAEKLKRNREYYAQNLEGKVCGTYWGNLHERLTFA